MGMASMVTSGKLNWLLRNLFLAMLLLAMLNVLSHKNAKINAKMKKKKNSKH